MKKKYEYYSYTSSAPFSEIDQYHNHYDIHALEIWIFVRKNLPLHIVHFFVFYSQAVITSGIDRNDNTILTAWVHLLHFLSPISHAPLEGIAYLRRIFWPAIMSLSHFRQSDSTFAVDVPFPTSQGLQKPPTCYLVDMYMAKRSRISLCNQDLLDLVDQVSFPPKIPALSASLICLTGDCLKLN